MSSIVYFTIFSIVGLAMSLTWAVYRTLTTTGEKAEFDRALEIIQSSELNELDSPVSLSEITKEEGFSWNKWWLKIVLRAGRVPDDPDSPGRFALGALAIGIFFGVFVAPGGLTGIIVGPVVLLAGYLWLDYEAGKRKVAMEKQMPILLSALRSQMHAGVTVQAALMNIADELPSPLGDEVRMVKQDVNVSIPLDQALVTLAERVNSRQMQFLVSSIGIAVKSGSDLVPQLAVIEEIAEQRARIEGKIKSAVALARPTALLAEIAPVGAFVWFAFSDPYYLGYFFGDGIIMLGVAAGMYAAGIVAIRLMVKNVEKA